MRDQRPFHTPDARFNPLTVGFESGSEASLAGDPKGGGLAVSVGLGASRVKQGAFECPPAKFVRLEHAAVDEQDAAVLVRTRRGTAQGVVKALECEVAWQFEGEGRGRHFASVLGRSALALRSAWSRGLPRVGTVGGQTALGDGLADNGGWHG
ncbi:hypothetical protein [uncultured Paludibaculum sp.]|uniref:hypothetical protein n=1 Tax=uncultured Paludibaculum sp. TaxID=1765020 RepID=UPI002AAA8B7B|nr:hypothetical protein [uncultured Paludibaculum sp.]